jgi:hypothetical protein
MYTEVFSTTSAFIPFIFISMTQKILEFDLYRNGCEVRHIHYIIIIILNIIIIIIISVQQRVLDKPTASQQVNKFSEFYQNRKFFTVLKITQNLSLL